jgi:hypothetical protein
MAVERADDYGVETGEGSGVVLLGGERGGAEAERCEEECCEREASGGCGAEVRATERRAVLHPWVFLRRR